MSPDPQSSQTPGEPAGWPGDERREGSERRGDQRRAGRERRLRDRRRGGGAGAHDPTGSRPLARNEADGEQAEINAQLWTEGRYLRSYDHDELLPAESVLLARYASKLTGRVLDVGCGAGRTLGYLVTLGADAHGVDISPRMVDHCLATHPGTDVRVGDLADLPAVFDETFDVLLLTNNVIDVFDDVQRRQVLTDLHTLLAPDGLLVFSSHNLDAWERPGEPGAGGKLARVDALARKAAQRSIAWWGANLLGIPARRRNRRRLAPLQRREADYAIVNDPAHYHGLLHYYIGRAAQERQLAEAGYDLIDVIESHGPSVPPGREGESGSLYYVAKSAT
jgi:SAM-dependent methyltransferase